MALVLACAASAAPRRAAAVQRGDTVWLENEGIRLGFAAANGALLALTDRATGQAFVGAQAAADGLWRLDRFAAAGAQGEASPAVITPMMAHGFMWRRLEGDTPGVALVWTDFGLEDAPDLSVTATVRLQRGVPMSEWRIVVDSPGGIAIEQVRFPRIMGMAPLGPGEELAVPRWMGALSRDPAALLAGESGEGRRLEWAYPGALSLQMLALYRRGGAGFYAATDDTLAYRKEFALWADARGSRGFEVTHPVSDPQRPRARWMPPYAVLLGTFRGDWISAAERYREWGTRQLWARESRLRRGLVPDWLLKTGMWVWNRGRSSGVVDPAVALREELRLPVSIFWHWWHRGPYDTSFPDYLPPREGVASFRAALERAHSADVRAIVYMNQRLWCIGTPSWEAEGAARWAVKEKDGRVREEIYNVFDPQPCATMDVTTAFWRDKYAGIADTVIDEYGVDGIYMDQAVLSLVCWDPEHDHPVGGGNYWMGGFRALAGQIREGASGQALLAGEGAGEAWLPELDLMLTLQVSWERYSAPSGGWEPIPLFQAVYHAYGITYGSYSSLVMPPYDDLWPKEFAPEEPLALLDRRFQRQFYLEQARSFVWGVQPTIANFRASLLEERPEEIAYMLRLARLRAQALDYLLYGTFVRPPALDVDTVEVDLSRISIYAGQRGGPRVSTARYPAAMAGAWRAADGSVAIAIASILAEPTTVSFEFDPRAYDLEGGGQIVRVGEDGRSPLGTFRAQANPIRLELPPGGAYVLEFRRSGP